jgi:hypothetical protein
MGRRRLSALAVRSPVVADVHVDVEERPPASVGAGAHFASVRRSPTSPTIRRRQVRRSPSAGWRAHSGDGVWPVATATPADDSPDRAGGGEVLRTWAAIAIGGAQAFARHAVPAVRRPTPSRRRTSASYRRFPPTLAGFRDVAGGAGQLAAPSAELLRHPRRRAPRVRLCLGEELDLPDRVIF